MNLTYLEQFSVIARCENMAEAAEILHISQPALSYSLSKLEDELGVKLFDRTKNRIRLNDAGRQALEFSNEILSSVDRMSDYFRSYSSVTTQMRFVSSSISGLRGIMTRFMQEVPYVRISSSTSMPDRIPQMILSSEYDIGLSTEYTENESLIYIPLCEDRLHLMVPPEHRLRDSSSCCFRDISGETLILTSENVPVIHTLDEISRRYHINQIHCDDYIVYRNLCQTTDYLFVVASLGLSYYKQELSMRCPVPVTDPEAVEQIYIVYAKGREKKLSPFLDWIEKNRDSLC